MENFQLEYDQMVQSLTSTYKNIFVIDPEEGTLVQMDEVENVKYFLNAGNTIQEKLDAFVSGVVTKEFAEQAYEFCKIDTVSERMGNDRVISCELKSIVAGWFRAQFILVDDSDGSQGKYLFTTQIIENQKQEVEEQRRISKILSDEYHTVHIFDFINNECKEIRTNEFLHTMFVLNEFGGIQAVLEQSMRAVCVPAYLDELLEFIDFGTLPERMKDKDSISLVFAGVMQGFTKATFLKYERDEEGNLIKALFVTQVIDKQRRREEELLKNSMTDELSGLLNRRAYDEELKCIKTEGVGRDICFASLDLNGLKEINDTKGHAIGDELIKGTAICLERCFGQYGKVFRIGGDEFAAIIKAKKNQMIILADDLEEITLNWHGENIDSISISLGYVCAQEFPNASLEEILDTADDRMYVAKEAYYSSKGVDRRGQKIAYTAICETCQKILQVNLTNDTYQIIKMNSFEKAIDKGFSDTFSTWISEFGKSGQVHPQDLDRYLEKTKLDSLKKHFKSGSKALDVLYRRVVDGEYRYVVMEMIPSDMYSDDNQDVFLYVKEVDI